MNFRNIVLSASALALVVVIGCSSSSTSIDDASCPTVGSKNCPNDTATTQQTVDLCNKCLSESKTYAKCAGLSAKASCGADGKSVVAMVDPNKCQTELKAVTDCYAR